LGCVAGAAGPHGIQVDADCLYSSRYWSHGRRLLCHGWFVEKGFSGWGLWAENIV
jgi:hypothetical protein